jgi:abortive infection alpha-like protein
MTEERTDDSLLRAAPGLARIATSAWWNATGWTVGASLRVGTRVFQAAASGRPPREVFEETGADAREYARRVLGLRVEAADEPADAEGATVTTQPGGTGHRAPSAALRERGAELLRQSADVHYDEDLHPAYARILEALAPDEARILRLLAREGAQPAVDVRRGLPLASSLVAGGLTMIGAAAGCRHLDRVHAYLNNLFRLGLVWFSRERVEDPLRYQVLEAQPEVVEALREAGRTGRTVRRSIHLTPFGEDFCEACLPVEAAEREPHAEPAVASEEERG